MKKAIFFIMFFVAFCGLAKAASGSRTIKINKINVHVNPSNSTRGYIWFSDNATPNNGYLYLTDEVDLNSGAAKSFLSMLMFAKANSQCVIVYFMDSNYPQFINEIGYLDQCP